MDCGRRMNVTFAGASIGAATLALLVLNACGGSGSGGGGSHGSDNLVDATESPTGTVLGRHSRCPGECQSTALVICTSSMKVRSSERLRRRVWSRRPWERRTPTVRRTAPAPRRDSMLPGTSPSGRAMFCTSPISVTTRSAWSRPRTR